MKKAILAAAMVMAMGSTSAMAADAEGGQINFHGLVSATTCSKVISGERGSESVDGNVYIQTAAPADIKDEVSSSAFGTNATPFSIKLICTGDATITDATVASMLLDSPFSNTKGTLNNDEALTVAGMTAAHGVNVAIHNADSSALVKVDGSTPATATFTAADKTATFNFVASYVKANATDAVTAGHVTTNAMYTFTYQ